MENLPTELLTKIACENHCSFLLRNSCSYFNYLFFDYWLKNINLKIGNMKHLKRLMKAWKNRSLSHCNIVLSDLKHKKLKKYLPRFGAVKTIDLSWCPYLKNGLNHLSGII
eukprot:TRINITY_DN2381_c1_g1_i2.p1 TRINITY_DN2381_c1_g1~~TRINITY_DN2381_c1_g1_i2.p1  ORF type:complete len:111 (-),score=7.72 TRINITY_DN2381_c1_g1_i2:398-730(-)